MEEKREKDKEYKRKQRSTAEGRKKSKEANEKAKKKLKIEDSMDIDIMENLAKKIETVKRKNEELLEELRRKEERIEFLERCLETERVRDVEELEIEDAEPEHAEEPKEVPLFAEIMAKEEDLKYLTRMTKPQFEELCLQAKDQIAGTTLRGTERKYASWRESAISVEFGLFLTLFWMAHYPTLSFIRSLFHIHERTITRILKRTIIGLSQALAHEIRWPMDEEFEQRRMDFCFFQNDGFERAVCVIDGTELRISRPSKEPLQRQTWSGKKKQNSLNVMFITLLNGEIIFFSPVRIGAHDQAHFNELNLRERFIGKHFGILGDGGFFFNRHEDTVMIEGYKPIKSPKTAADKLYNKRLSQMRVVVENSIRRVKQWRIFQGVYRHWRLGQGQIPINDILTVAVVLANRSIKECPPRQGDWMAPEWKEIFQNLYENE